MNFEADSSPLDTSREDLGALGLISPEAAAHQDFDRELRAEAEQAQTSLRTVMLGVLTFLAVVGACYAASVVLIPLLLSVFLFLLVEPMVRWAAGHHIPRTVSAPAFLLVSMLVASSLVWGGYGACAKVAKDIPRYSVKIRSAMESFQGNAKLIQNGTRGLLPSAEEVQKVEIVDGLGGSWTHALLRGIDSIFGIITTLFLIPMLTLFFLLERAHLRDGMSRTLGNHFPMKFLGYELTQMVRGFFVGNLLVGLGTSVGFYAIFMAMGLENSFPLALSAGFLNLIPLLGSLIGALFPMAQAVLQFDTMGPVALILISSLVLHLIVGNLVIPKVVGSKINVNATAATIGLAFWGFLWGGMGLILAVPLMAMLRILLSARISTRPWADLIAETKAGPLQQQIWLPKRVRGRA